MDRVEKILLVFLAANAELVQVAIMLAPTHLSPHASVPAPIDAGALMNFVSRGSDGEPPSRPSTKESG